jgi:hypothetical protein
MRSLTRRAAFLVAILAGAVVCLRGAPLALLAPPAPCPDCLKARYWQIDPHDFEKAGDATFPESDFLKDRLDLGIAFSGGGTRSATAELGQLRGLHRLGWLSRVRYVSAVSGGGWAAIPFVYSKQPLDDLLGKYQSPDALNLDEVKKVANGWLGVAISKSSLVSGAIREGTAIYLSFRERAQDAPNPLLKEIVWLTNRMRREGERDDKTYARMLGDIFVSDKLVEPEANKNLFSWNAKTIADMMAINPGKLPVFVVPHAETPPGRPAASGPDRPFLIAGGTLVSARRDYAYPLLMPVEYTPMYVGVRQTFGLFGGTYVWPWAYDPVEIGQAMPDAAGATAGGGSSGGGGGSGSGGGGSGLIDVKIDSARRFTLADVAASTGAAPEIPALQAFGLEEPFKSRVEIAATFFPHFKHFAVHDPNRVILTKAIPHGDGGGIENLGVMPLLARHVHNILVFNNTSEPCVERNSDMQALFLPGAEPDVTSDTRGDQVFDPEEWEEVKNAMVAQREAGQPQVYCGVDWSVQRNQRYNIRAYDHVNICFVYNASAAEWETQLAKSQGVLSLLRDPKANDTTPIACRARGTTAGTGKLQNFPYFATFEQNKPHLIQLTVPQVNLFANLTAWTISNQSTVTTVTRAMKDLNLPCPAGMTCGK